MDEGKYSFEFAEARRCAGGCAQPPKLTTPLPARTATTTRTDRLVPRRIREKTEMERTETHKFRFACMRVPLARGLDLEAGLCRFSKDRQTSNFIAFGFRRLKAMAKPSRSSTFKCDQSAALSVPWDARKRPQET